MASGYDGADYDHPAWRRPAPRARAITMSLYSWREPSLVFILSMIAAAPFILAALLSPALLSLAPTVNVIAPIADARAIVSGAADINSASSPFYLALLMAGDLFFDTPGQVHLAAKAFAATLVASPLAYFAAARFPAAQAVLMTAGLAAFVAAPFAGPLEISLAFFAALAVTLICAPADESASRARLEGFIAGIMLFALWISHPIFALLGFLALSACPFLTGKRGLDRYVVALAASVLLALCAEMFAPGLNIARAEAASGALTGAVAVAQAGSVWGLAGVAASTAIVLFASAVFGGREHAKGWLAASIFLVISLVAVRIAGAQGAPLFALAAAIAAFSVSSPFYDGVFRFHDRASVAIAGSVAALTLFWTAAIIAQSAGQFALQFKTATTAQADVRAAFGLVQPGGPTIARWIEEGRFSTPEARDLFSLAPVDQSAILLEAADRARALTREGYDVAFLTGADTACVIANSRACSADGPAAAKGANIVFVPRLDLDEATAKAKGRSEAMLYTEFKMAERTALWDVWVRRGVKPPAGMIGASLP
ncbi:MAG: hypothetical protein A3E78_15465 [Alphaproteobacteria bacterium RIFCSPHIGHO2_12_FULL_63_12]|nr:MAG: hypothetical protein A3E78_15465 [Alphaproteobacteria bacterium RIFCSPHIGHO2_12_FULL_63_12]